MKCIYSKTHCLYAQKNFIYATLESKYILNSLIKVYHYIEIFQFLMFIK